MTLGKLQVSRIHFASATVDHMVDGSFEIVGKGN
jgi:hypothetical protein